MTLQAADPAARPLQLCSREQLLTRFAAALAAADGASGAHCIHELWMRGEWPQRIEDALQQLWQHAAASIPDWLPMRYIQWLPLAYEIAGRFRKLHAGRTHVYLILLDYSDRRGDPYGIYVGMSHYRPAVRFDQHKAGIRAAASVLKRGIEVLTGPTRHLQYVARPEAVRIEVALARAFQDSGLAVAGGH